MPTGDLGVGVVGSGDMGGTYAEAIARHTRGARLVAITSGRGADSLAAEYGAEHVAGFDKLIARSDIAAVIIALPHSLHRDHVVAAVRAGKHVLVEKPMALNVRECDEMMAAARSNGVDLSVILTMRFDTNMRLARQRLDSGAIGDVRMLRLSGLTPGYDMGQKRWIADPANGGALLDWGSHGFDILRWIAGADPVRLSAELARFGDVAVGEPSAMVQIAYTNGVLAQMWMSYELPPPGMNSPFRLWIVGSSGILEVNRFGESRIGRGDSWQVFADDGSPDWTVERRLDPIRLVAPVRQVQDWVDSLVGHRPSSAPAEAGRWAVMQVEAAYWSWQQGEIVRLPFAP